MRRRSWARAFYDTFRQRGIVFWVLLLSVAAGVRLYGLTDHGPYWDEVISLSNATGSHLLDPIGSFAEFTQEDFWRGNSSVAVPLTVSRVDGNAVLYALILHFWVAMLGTADAVVRLPSVIFGVLVVALVHRLTAALLGDAAAWCAASLAAIHPLLVQYSREAKGTILATLLALIATLAFVEIWRARDGRCSVSAWVKYGLSAGGAMLSAYTVGWVFVAHFVFAVLRFRDARVVTQYARGACLAAGLFLVWVPTAATGVELLARGHERVRAVADTPEGLGAGSFLYPSTPRFVAGGALQTMFGMTGNGAQLLAAKYGIQLRQILPLVVVPFYFVIVALRWSERSGTTGPAAGLLLCILAFATPVFNVMIAFAAGHTTSLRPLYALHATPYLIALIGAGIAATVFKRGTLRKLSAALLIVAVASATAGLWAVYKDALFDRRPNQYAILAAALASSVGPNDVVVYPRWIDARLCNLYLPPLPRIRQRVDGKAFADASIRLAWLLPNAPGGKVVTAGPSTEPIRVLRDGREVAAFRNPALY